MPEKYLLQKNHYSCGPVSVFNARIWQREHCNTKNQPSYPSFRQIIQDCDPSHEWGTEPHRILFNQISIQTSKPSRMAQWLDQGHGFILLYCNTRSELHYVFVYPCSTHSSKYPLFRVLNNINHLKREPDYIHETWTSWIKFKQCFLTGYNFPMFDHITPSTSFPIAWRITYH